MVTGSNPVAATILLAYPDPFFAYPTTNFVKRLKEPLDEFMKCKFCGTDTKLIEAHNYPGWLLSSYKKGERSLEMTSNKADKYTKRVPIGVYDRNIVCGKCESIWQTWDDYAQQLLTDEPHNWLVRFYNGKELCYVVNNYDYKKLKLFFISLAWRASVSEQPFYSEATLGQFEGTAKKHIENSDPGNSEDFSVTLAKFTHRSAKATLNPHCDQFSGVNYLRFYFAGYIAYIKADNKRTPAILSRCAITDNKPLYIVCRDFTGSKELDLMQALAKDYIKNNIDKI